MNTRSRQRKQAAQEAKAQTLNGSITTLPDTPTTSALSGKLADGRTSTRHTADSEVPSKPASTPIKKRPGIYRVPIATWNFFVRKWEIPRKTLHVSIGK